MGSCLTHGLLEETGKPDRLPNRTERSPQKPVVDMLEGLEDMLAEDWEVGLEQATQMVLLVFVLSSRQGNKGSRNSQDWALSG